MDGIEKIIERINAAAAEECAAIAQKAESDCAAIRSEYEKKLQAAYESAIEKGEKEIGLDAERMLRTARLDARKELLLAKQNVLDTAFQTAKEKLLNLPEDQYIAWLASLACKASDGSGEIILSARDKELGEKLLAKANEALIAKGKQAGLKLSNETRNIDAGFILLDGRTEVNCSVSSILEDSRQAMAAKVAEKLFD
ncbi:MAG: V-type ATP synthase subunit E [Oscillospiraceae bacterium]|nr:V-type ATP synthase subunit E [Oscillospiraceae bacterium]